jgi:starch synthase
MKVLFVSSEISPYASTGGLADVVGALPIALADHAIDVVRVMPMYRRIAEGKLARSDTGLRIKVPVGLRTLEAEIWQSDEPGPSTYFVRKDEFFDRRELYSLPERDYDDNFERFVFFQKAVVGLIDVLEMKPDIVHANDWQAALMPYFLEYGMQGMGRGRAEKVVFTIHNMAFQGVFADSEFPISNLPYSCFSLDQLEYYGNLNCMKGALIMSDAITTVSGRYAQEILTPEFGCGLEGVLADLEHKLTGIVNGVDYSVWNPETDMLIAANYAADDLSGKETCKNDLLKEMGLKITQNKRVPLIGLVSRLADQKGMDLLAESMDSIMEEDVQFVLLGSGQDIYQDLCHQWAKKWPGRFAIYIGYNQALAHQVEAGSDFFMMPSKFEPCGLNQLYSLRYGTVPVVHATGGLDDTITNIPDSAADGNGFKFATYTVDDLLSSVRAGLALYKNQAEWCKVQKRIMQQDFSWTRSAKEYAELYRRIVAPA